MIKIKFTIVQVDFPHFDAGVREFQCSSFKEFLAWKEEEEEMNNVFYAQTTGRKVLNDTTNIDEIGTMQSI